MSDVVIKVENLTKEYRLGVINHGTLAKDLQAWWAKMRGKEDPNSRIDTSKGKKSFAPTQLTPTSSPLSLPKRGDGGEFIYALKDINFSVSQGEVLGIIGSNGAGKSTLLKILSRVTSPTSGCVKIKGRIGSLLEVGTGFHPELTGRENIYLNGAILGMRKWEIDKKLDEIIDFSGVEKFIDTPVKRYSSGMYVRLAFAVAAHLDPEILVVDEVLAVGDAEFQKKCLGKMGDISKKEGRTVLFVSHNMGAVKQLCERALLLEFGNITIDDTVYNSIEFYFRNMYKTSDCFDKITCIPLTDKIAIKNSYILNSSGKIVENLVSGSFYSFIVSFVSKENFSNVRVILKIEDMSGRTFLTLSNFWTGQSFEICGEGKIVFETLRFPLPEGSYTGIFEIRGDGLKPVSAQVIKINVVLNNFFKITKKSIQDHGVFTEHNVKLTK